MTWEIPVLEFLCNCNNDLFHYLLTCWLHGNLGYSIICYIETEQLDLFVSVKEDTKSKQVLNREFKDVYNLDPQFHYTFYLKITSGIQWVELGMILFLSYIKHATPPSLVISMLLSSS